MISYIKGIITSITTNYIVIEKDNLGFIIKTPNPFDFIINEEIIIHTYLNVKENALDLYGFKTIIERDFFVKLISVKGLGPKGGLAILGSGNIENVISAIEKGDNKYLQKFPGVGPKSSQQIILDLHGKIDFKNEKPNPNTDKAIEALLSLGYKNSEIKKITPLIEENNDKPIGEIIKIALKNLL
ncbi:MAG: Holliday junction branch migration protein RuvA [Bacilli bacterium]|jgi:Holliday junction DNA helicase RuvA|nr:Holliday junction branch migration protein RuvA [Bacilli bacterium]MDD2681422.1 Holliday junction branch migration protein RuvA [Bacilli bacterium]MDD3121205.1 Holliday junction branch migration protein RuvA [Bacilli bacterium]MDD4062846.1 Holliday junction branch migration protein RuvA [Bacilli bacterium]MDD4481897.1 Holliday junction branch migration protein RuvA [Bacilli bacterium]